MHSSRRSILGLGVAGFAALALTSMHMPAHGAALDPGSGRKPYVMENAQLTITGVGSQYDGIYEIVNLGQADLKVVFVDGVYVVPGGEQLRLFYRDQVYKPKGQRTAAMQPDNGAGQVSGDRAQSVGKAGDLKADRPGEVKSQVPGAQKVDATKPQSWVRRVLWPARPVPS